MDGFSFQDYYLSLFSDVKSSYSRTVARGVRFQQLISAVHEFVRTYIRFSRTDASCCLLLMRWKVLAKLRLMMIQQFLT